MTAKFGPAGQCEQSRLDKIKTTEKFLEYIKAKNLTAFEYQCGRGVRVSPSKAQEIKKVVEQTNIEISLHAPYYISLASMEQEKRDNSINYIMDSAIAINAMGGNRIVIHPGGLGKYTREQATSYAIETLIKAQKALDQNNLSNIRMCVETMGKINQLGDFNEVLQMCKIDERILPTIDFGHLNARTHGSILTIEDYAVLLDEIKNSLGQERYENFHSHFSKIEFSKGGEVRHLTFEDTVYGPQYEPLMELVFNRNISPTFICESAGTQTEDSVLMKNYYENLK